MKIIDFISVILEEIVKLYIQFDSIINTIKNVAFSEFIGIPLVIVEVGSVLLSAFGFGVAIYKKIG